MRLNESRRHTIKISEHRALRVFADGYLVGQYQDVARSGGGTLYLPTVITPTGQPFSLHQCTTWFVALNEILAAASEYDYRPHPITIVRRHGVVGHRHTYLCPTCVDGGRTGQPFYPNEQEATASARRDHYTVTGHPAVLHDKPAALPLPQPPTNSTEAQRHMPNSGLLAD
ncbi:hypothetical protein GCM10012275_50480 [Longimycelium tulufanense]|uniref:Uncharacterized protein n=1 Tax=Longimycelium tulufanense TaxID=907463 RepID=A0A8J3FXE6_9PSEU|nr:hypothetical protein [Longimycelium tulufanense]GGM73641.1 hypothetical protein GCM10012275_50480 [Longimycelium tulufanense]